ncbi:recombinase family protein [Acidimicrobiia bacterium EGI L10123]|uniref:recombinase family protein n=1 Tax=Salinilacustrithrix flava TaxID=2957203 RepID=UPI003D7C29C8|nr:recombinase family protein [Acidimicrobiia bacterium EGI L10123]
MPTRAAIYARQSRTGEGSESLELQVERCRESAERHGLEVVVELVEPPSTSGYKNRGRDRARFKQLIDLTRVGDVDCVVVYKTDRLSRGGGPGYAPLVDAIEAAGGDPNRFILADNSWVAEFELSIRAAMDREASALTAARMADVRGREAAAGKPRPGIARGYGYERDCVSLIDDEAARIKEAASRVLDGESVYSVAQDWNRQGVPSTGGGQWSTHVLRKLLRQPRIAGLREHHGVVVAVGQWPAIISVDEHERLLAVTAARRHGRKKAPRTYPLVGFLRCGRCGTNLRSLGREGGKRSYACRSGEEDGCGGLRIKAEWVEDAVRDYVVGVLTDPLLVDRLVAALPLPDDSTQRDALEQLRQLELRRDRITDLLVDGSISKADAKRKRLEVDDAEAVLQRTLADKPASRTLTNLPSTAHGMLAAWNERGIDYQRSLINLMIDQITIHPAGAVRRSFDPDRLSWSLRV